MTVGPKGLIDSLVILTLAQAETVVEHIAVSSIIVHPVFCAAPEFAIAPVANYGANGNGAMAGQQTQMSEFVVYRVSSAAGKMQKSNCVDKANARKVDVLLYRWFNLGRLNGSLVAARNLCCCIEVDYGIAARNS